MPVVRSFSDPNYGARPFEGRHPASRPVVFILRPGKHLGKSNRGRYQPKECVPEAGVDASSCRALARCFSADTSAFHDHEAKRCNSEWRVARNIGQAVLKKK
jgi:hypothetical protein